MLGYLAGDVLPQPTLVGRFVDEVFSGQLTGLADPPGLRSVDTDDGLWHRLAGYSAG